jgi:hypothetical protein
MEKDNFDQLIESIKQAGGINRGEGKPVRKLRFSPDIAANDHTFSGSACNLTPKARNTFNTVS